MTKYELLYGVKVEHFPNEKKNVRKKLGLATDRYFAVYLQPYSDEQQKELHEIHQAIQWCKKILEDIDE